MGSPENEKQREPDERSHEVELTGGFYIAETEVTQKDWQRLVARNPSRFAHCEDCPVEQVSWHEAVTYANLLSRHAGRESCYEIAGCQGTLGGGCGGEKGWCQGDYVCSTVSFKGLRCNGYRLPTEAEWEYAARAGTETPFWTGENLTTDQANYDGTHPYAGHRRGDYRQQTARVRSFVPNPWQLYEIHGNVWEWVWDAHGPYPSRFATDPIGNGSALGTDRIFRGGSWLTYAHSCRAAKRGWLAPDTRSADIGFRLVRGSSDASR